MAEVHAHMALQQPEGALSTGVAETTDPYVGKRLVMVRGKYKGRSAVCERKVKQKWRLQVDGVDWGLEFYDNMFEVAPNN